jgi:hypothetical protein
MSSDGENQELETPQAPTLVVDKTRFIQGINALTTLYHDALITYDDCRLKIGDAHPATRASFQQVRMLGGIVAHFTDLVTLNEEDLKKLKSLN